MDLRVRLNCHGVFRDGPVHFAFLRDAERFERHQLGHLDGESLILRVFVDDSVLLVQSVDLEDTFIAFGPRVREALDPELHFLSFCGTVFAETVLGATYVDEGTTLLSPAGNALDKQIFLSFYDQLAVLFHLIFVGNTDAKGEILGQEDAEESSDWHLVGHLEVEGVRLVGLTRLGRGPSGTCSDLRELTTPGCQSVEVQNVDLAEFALSYIPGDNLYVTDILNALGHQKLLDGHLQFFCSFGHKRFVVKGHVDLDFMVVSGTRNQVGEPLVLRNRARRPLEFKSLRHLDGYVALGRKVQSGLEGDI